LQRNKLSRSRACYCNAASSHASEPKSSEACCVAASKLRRLLRCNSKLSRSRACCCNAASFHTPELVAVTQQALTLRSRKASKLAALQQASFEAGQVPEFVALQQQALTLWSLLLQRNKLSCFGACCVAASKLRRLLLQRNKLRSRTSSGVCCVAAASSHAPEVVASSGAEKLRSRTSSGACCVARFSCSKQASEPRSSEAGQAPELATLQGLVAASKLRSREAPELAALQGLVATSKLRSREAPEKLRSLELACLFKQNK